MRLDNKFVILTNRQSIYIAMLVFMFVVSFGVSGLFFVIEVSLGVSGLAFAVVVSLGVSGLAFVVVASLEVSANGGILSQIESARIIRVNTDSTKLRFLFILLVMKKLNSYL